MRSLRHDWIGPLLRGEPHTIVPMPNLDAVIAQARREIDAAAREAALTGALEEFGRLCMEAPGAEGTAEETMRWCRELVAAAVGAARLLSDLPRAAEGFRLARPVALALLASTLPANVWATIPDVADALVAFREHEEASRGK